MKKLLKDILDFLLPPRCLSCGKILTGTNGLCAECFNELTFISSPYCKKCGHPFTDGIDNKARLCGGCIQSSKTKLPIRLMRSSMFYDDKSRKLIFDFKFYDKTENSAVFAVWLKSAAKDILEEGIDVIIPVPLHYTRLLKRRYNQSSLMAKELSKLVNVKVDYDSLKRHKRTRPQMGLEGKVRRNNVVNAFSVGKTCNIKGKRVLLIDDVMTTGSTLKECAKTLEKSGAKSVDVLTLARVVNI